MRGTLLAIAVSLLGVAAGSYAMESSGEDEATGFKVAKGRVTFRTYCASCHGREAKGDGNLARYLTVEPADLTGIAARRAGDFPREEIAEIIDGRRQAKGHGVRDMPVWGDVFQSPLSETERAPAEEAEERSRRKVEELVLFLESIQAQP